MSRSGWRAALAMALVAATLLFLVPPPPQAPSTSGLDKLGHFLIFAALAFLALRASAQRAPLLFAALVAYGAAIEVAQSFTGRHMEALDLAADALGATVVFLPIPRVAAITSTEARRA